MAGNLFGKMAADTLGLSDIGKIIEPKDFNKVDGDDYIMHEDGEKIYFVIKSKSDEYVFTNMGLIHVDGASAVSKKRVVKRHEFYTENVHSVTLETAGSKSDEYVFTNMGLIHVDGASAVSKKRVVKRHEFYTENVHSVTLETAGTVDLDVEIKFAFGNDFFSIDVDKKQIEQLKDLYKALFEIGKIQRKNDKSYENGISSLNMANEAIGKSRLEGDAATMLEEITKLFEIGKIQRKNDKSYENGISSLNMANEAIGKSRLEGDAATMLEEITKFNFGWMTDMKEQFSNKDFGEVFEKYINN